MVIRLRTELTCDYENECDRTLIGTHLQDVRSAAGSAGWLILRLGAVSFCPTHRIRAEDSVKTP